MEILLPFLYLLASSDDKELARMVECHKEENRILRDRLPKKIEVTTKERNRLVRDRDTKYVKEFDAVFESEGVKIKPVGPFTPNMNPYCERVIQRLKQECLIDNSPIKVRFET